MNTSTVSVINGREELAHVLGCLERLRNKETVEHPRRKYLEDFRRLTSAYYGYSECLVERLLWIFSPEDTFAYIEANESQRPVTLRVNTLQAKRKDILSTLTSKGCVVEASGDWSREGIQVFETSIPLGATAEYLAGMYMVQSAASFLPVLALNLGGKIQRESRVLDMCAAPGGKTTHLAAEMKNKGILLANDKNKERTKGLIANVHRMNIQNTIVTNFDGTLFPKYVGMFEWILLDAPCSGSGIISKNPEAKTSNNVNDLKKLVLTQKNLLEAAVRSIGYKGTKNRPTHGYIVYSTCSVLSEENEVVVNHILKKFPEVSLIETNLSFGDPGLIRCRKSNFHPTMHLARRYYPHRHNTDGFFVAKLSVPIPPIKKSRKRNRNKNN